jgi:hypothetical protein
MYCRAGFTAEGEVNLIGARIGRALDLDGGHFTNPGARALHANRITVEQTMLCRNGFVATGEVRLIRAKIDGWLDFRGASLNNREGPALDLRAWVDEAPNLTPAGVTKRPKRSGSCPGHSSWLAGERIRKSAVNQSQTGAIPHSLAGSGSSDSKMDSAWSARSHGTWCVPRPPGNSRAMSRTTSASAVSRGIMGKSNQQPTGEASVRMSRKRSQAFRASLAEIRPSACALPPEIGSPS